MATKYINMAKLREAIEQAFSQGVDKYQVESIAKEIARNKRSRVRTVKAVITMYIHKGYIIEDKDKLLWVGKPKA